MNNNPFFCGEGALGRKKEKEKEKKGKEIRIIKRRIIERRKMVRACRVVVGIWIKTLRL